MSIELLQTLLYFLCPFLMMMSFLIVLAETKHSLTPYTYRLVLNLPQVMQDPSIIRRGPID